MTSPRRTIRRGLCGTVAASLAALVTACGSATPSAAPAGSTSTPKTSTPAATSSPSASATASPSASSQSPAASPSGPAGGGGTAACATRQLRATAAPGQGTAGSVYALIRFTNLGGAACTLYGYPGVSFGAGTPVAQVGLAATENPGTPRELVTLGAGGTASALLQITDAGNFSPGQCHRTTATWLKIYPPNQTAPIYVRYTSPTCAGRVHILTVGAVRPGSTAGA